jgi:uncharacterized membrane protein YcaP (DUF421 family)
MGKRQVGEMQPFELVITIMFCGLAVIPMSNINIPVTSAVISILVLLAVEILLSLLNLYSEKARSIICGTPNFSSIISKSIALKKSVPD